MDWKQKNHKNTTINHSKQKHHIIGKRGEQIIKVNELDMVGNNTYPTSIVKEACGTSTSFDTTINNF
jgi:hypothetical protein